MNKTIPALALVLASCATPPQIHHFDKSWDMPSSFDKTWTATVEVFAEKGWPIANIEKDSGLIASEWVRLNANDGFADCGSPGLAISESREVKFSVFVKDGTSSPRLTVNTQFREHRRLDTSRFIQDCTSYGTLEARIRRQILDILEE